MASLKWGLALGLAAMSAMTVSAAPASVLKSRLTEGVKVTYKEPNICETTPGVKSYSGYVTLPHTTMQGYEQNMFFWFFEARNSPETAPLTVWLQGGPGSPSIDQALDAYGPCYVNPDSNSTRLNEWSWNNHANMLFIDQPVQTGFSYDEIAEGIMDRITGDIYLADEYDGPLNYTAVAGKFASQNLAHTVNTTAVSAEAIYEFVQVWMGEFKQYSRDSINIWSQSYGGHFAPAIANLFHERHAAASQRRGCSGGPKAVAVNSVGIINGMIDMLVMGEYIPYFPVNNTYGIQGYNDTSIADAAWEVWDQEGGCRDLIKQCRALTADGYHGQKGDNDTITEFCYSALAVCGNKMYYVYDTESPREHFDITQQKPTPESKPYMYGFLTQEWVQEALGARVNYTTNHSPTTNTFLMTGDFLWGGFNEDLGKLVDAGVQVALIHGDRDYRCNWVGGEAVSLAMPHGRQAEFAAAGYADVVVDGGDADGSTVGFVRQLDNLSFTRVLEAGHSVAYYQPQAAHDIFTRTVFGRDIATGMVPVRDNQAAGTGTSYATEGPMEVFSVKNDVMPAQRDQECYVLSGLPETCSDEQLVALLDGSAVVQDDIVVSPAFSQAT